MSQESIPFEALARYAAEQSPDGMVFADREGTIRLWNGSAERIFGHPADEAVGHSLDLMGAISVDWGNITILNPTLLRDLS